ncbi:MAG TPA: phenylalanine--tRNA ligase subunit alpha [Acetobacteraceae bacterium]|nr:phenylalanine--tRNA ligase subunit alpha [Acetobacteraceae bacterium]
MTSALPADLVELGREAGEAIEAAGDAASLEALRVSLLGRQGRLTGLLRDLGALPAEERRERGARLNRLKDQVAAAITRRREELEGAALDAALAAERLDITLPPRPSPAGLIHPISRTIEEIVAIFGAMGFSVVSGPDIEDDWLNFGALNIPEHHPARQDMDTFYLPGRHAGSLGGHRRVLRTHTSPGQIRTMRGAAPPYRVIVPGRTYRADHDATHSPMFHQCEGLAIDRAITLGHLKGCLIDFLRAFFANPSLPVRFRSSYFPFTEPSMEVDIGWDRRTGEIGGGKDWLEILGSGMVHPRVLANCGVDPRAWQGFAFGMGIERITMLKHGITDLRPFFEGDLRWLRHYGFSPLQPAILHEGLQPG